ncbi:hypothetical protein VTJ04DRAFT_2681 [Mycothermus thermophilus]|uniref:uncharacterized protein n=1 Tax=Humicola insolens TaxID=85995 RepID=UPI0037443466
MRLTLALLLGAEAAASALLPSLEKQKQFFVQDHAQDEQNAVQAWWDTLSDPKAFLSPIDNTIANGRDFGNFLPLPGGDHGHHDHRDHRDKTIYDLIKSCPHTSKFAALVDEHDDIKKILQDTENNYTLFVPTNDAIDRIHHGHHHHHHPPPSNSFLLSVLKYHLAPSLYPLCRVHHSRTIPTLLHPPALAPEDSSSSSCGSSSSHRRREHHDQPQRIRSFSTPFLRRTYLNFHSRVIHGDIRARNGFVHALSLPLVPPPGQITLVRALPSAFSTFALALERTGVAGLLDSDHHHHHDDDHDHDGDHDGDHDHEHKNGGGDDDHDHDGDDDHHHHHAALPRAGGATLFAPTNHAWARLGWRANAFLFSPHGKKYLEALVRYHVVLNETVYSDAYYRGRWDHHDHDHDDGDDDKQQQTDFSTRRSYGTEGGRRRYWHIDLPTLLHNKPVSVDVKTWGAHGNFVSLVVNGFTRVLVRDGPADDGVIQVVDRVLIPPCEHHHGEHGKEDDGDGEMSVEELKRRLAPYVNGDGEQEKEEAPEEVKDL